MTKEIPVNRKFFIAVVFQLLIAASGSLSAQTTPNAPEEKMSPELRQVLKTSQNEQEKACRDQKPDVKRTYTFRDTRLRHPFNSIGERRLPEGLAGAYGPPPRYSWLRKIIPFWQSPVDKYGLSIHNFKNYAARDVPVNETKKSNRFRTRMENSLAAEADKKSALPRFDWRAAEHRLTFSPVSFQGWYCNNCWAYSAVEAMQISRQLVAQRAGQNNPLENALAVPSPRQTGICRAERSKKDPMNACEFDWHGEAFSYFVDAGMPLDGTADYDIFSNAWNWTCDAENSVKALTWDYVSANPQDVASVEEIKRAIIIYGAIATTLVFDDCLNLYGGGVFNEEQNWQTLPNGKRQLRRGNHIVLIIGWDDSKQAWLVKNSYGEEWGEKGYGWIKYASNNIGQFSAWVLADPEEKILPIAEK